MKLYNILYHLFPIFFCLIYSCELFSPPYSYLAVYVFAYVLLYSMIFFTKGIFMEIEFIVNNAEYIVLILFYILVYLEYLEFA